MKTKRLNNNNNNYERYTGNINEKEKSKPSEI